MLGEHIGAVHSQTLAFEDIVGMPVSEAFYQSPTYGEARFMLKFMLMTNISLDVLQ